jgi:UrcA family protein
MIGFSKRFAAAALVLALMPAAAGAQTVQTAVPLTGQLHPQSEDQARILLGRVENAATEACGASNFSVVDYSRAIRRSSCWKKSVSDTVVRIGSPILSEVYGRNRPDLGEGSSG